jgi:RNA polymerase sigma factor for flagellar operon FliA
MAPGQLAYGPQYDEDAAQRREALVLQHLAQVRVIARQIHDRLPDSVCLDDLISTGVIGLLAAVDNFDLSYNVQLNTYAERRIRGAIMDSLRELDWAPRETRKRSKMIEAAIHRAKQRVGREPSEEEIVAELGVTTEQYRQWLNDGQGIDLQRLESSEGDDRPDLLKFVADNEDHLPSRLFERAELERILTLAIERMPKIERTVLHLYYFEELTLREIATVVGMHLSRVAQLRVQAVLRLRSHLDKVWNSAARSRH